jgi:hypothetical protein
VVRGGDGGAESDEPRGLRWGGRLRDEPSSRLGPGVSVVARSGEVSACDYFRLPVLYVVDIPGFLSGEQAEGPERCAAARVRSGPGRR